MCAAAAPFINHTPLGGPCKGEMGFGRRVYHLFSGRGCGFAATGPNKMIDPSPGRATECDLAPTDSLIFLSLVVMLTSALALSSYAFAPAAAPGPRSAVARAEAPQMLESRYARPPRPASNPSSWALPSWGLLSGAQDAACSTLLLGLGGAQVGAASAVRGDSDAADLRRPSHASARPRPLAS